MQDRKLVQERIAKALVDLEIPKEIAEDIAFHMTDWKEDLEQMVRLYENAASLSDDQIQDMLMQFLAHVPNHVAAAKKLIGLGPIEDVFSVGVFEEDEG
jgi:hypothetical protein